MTIVALTCVPALATTELVYVAEVNALDEALIVRADGVAWRVFKGAGCLDLTSYEERYVLVHSPLGFFKPQSSEIILPDNGARCIIEDMEQLGYANISPRIRDLKRQPLTEQELRLLCQVALADLGYVVWADGQDTEDTHTALRQFQEENGIQASGEIGPVTVLAIAGKLLHGYTEDRGVLAVADALMVYARQELECKNDDRIDRVSEDGHVIVTASKIELFVHERDRAKASHWLHDETVLFCARVIYNMDNGELVEREL